MKKLIPYVALLSALSIAYLSLKSALYITNNNIYDHEKHFNELTQQATQLEKLAHYKELSRYISDYQKLREIDKNGKLLVMIRGIAAQNHVKIVECRSVNGGYELSFLADLDTEAYAFCQSCCQKLSGFLKVTSFGLFRPQNFQENLQGRLHLSLSKPIQN
jgi:hypothetical protein